MVLFYDSIITKKKYEKQNYLHFLLSFNPITFNIQTVMAVRVSINQKSQFEVEL